MKKFKQEKSQKTKTAYLRHIANLWNQSVTVVQKIVALPATFWLLQLLFAAFVDISLQSKSAYFGFKNHIHYLLHLEAALLKENLYLYIKCLIFIIPDNTLSGV